jgi:zona occludens toxin
MITYITGVPGSGKSLRAMWWLTQDEYKDRPVFSNMEGERSELPKGHACLPVDWQECPDGSVIVIDECQHRWPQRGPGSKTPPEESALDTHRHRGIDFILMTQRPTGVSHHVRGLVGKHEHLKRKAGAQMSFLQVSGEAFNPKYWNETKHLDSKLWRFPKDLYGHYKS